MGNNCKSVNTPSKVVEPHNERILFKNTDNNQRRTELLKKFVRTKAKRFSTSQNRDAKKYPPPPLMPMTEFIKICSRNRPAGIPDIVWDRLVSSICLECFWIDVQGEADKRGQMKAEPSSSRSSHWVAKKDSMLEEGRSTPTASDSIVEFAEKFVFTDVDNDKSDVVSKSLSSLSALSLSMYHPDRSFAIHHSDFSSDDSSSDEKTSWGYDKKLDLKYALSLGDLQCNSVEGKRWHDADQISSKETNNNTDFGCK